MKGKPFETSNTAVNKVNWNPFNKENIITASQDGSIKLWVYLSFFTIYIAKISKGY